MESCLRSLVIFVALQVGTDALRSNLDLEQLLLWNTTGYHWHDTDGRIPVWLWWNYTSEDGAKAPFPGYVAAAEMALNHFAPSDQFVIKKVNATNIEEFLPDWPEEMSTVYVQAISDVARAGLLSKFGGVYLDSDMLLATPLSDMTNLLDSHDMVSYEVGGQDCSTGSFSSNFMASRPKSELHTDWYEKIQTQVKSRCTEDPAPQNDPACCYAPTGERLAQCHVPWGGFGEKIGHKVLAELLADKSKAYKTYCFSYQKHDSFAPCIDCFWSSLPEGQGKVKTTCEVEGTDNLSCSDGHKPNFFKRRAYHLFSSIMPKSVHELTFAETTTGPFVFSQLFKRIMAAHV